VKNRIKIIGVFATLLILVLAACDQSSAPAIEQEVTEGPTLTKVGPGFSYNADEGSFNYSIDYVELTSDTVARVKDLAASKDISAYEAEQWQDVLTNLNENIAVMEQVGLSLAMPAAERSFALMSIEPGLSTQTKTDRLTGCKATATATPTSPSKGAKAYAKSSCPSGGAGTLKAHAYAYASTNVSSDSKRDSGSYNAYATMAKYGTSSCSSKGDAYVKNPNLMNITIVQEVANNSRCS